MGLVILDFSVGESPIPGSISPLPSSSWPSNLLHGDGPWTVFWDFMHKGDIVLRQYLRIQIYKIFSIKKSTFKLGVSSSYPWSEGSWLWNAGSADHDDLLLHGHHGLGPLLSLPGNVPSKKIHAGLIYFLSALSALDSMDVDVTVQ